jgi:Family of unknown function (DUF6529)
MAAPTVERDVWSPSARLLGIAAVGAAVSLFLGVYADSHSPTKEQPYTLFFSTTVNLKVWFATIALILAVVQVLLAMRLYGKLRWPREASPWLGDAHRITGTLAFLVSLPVAYQCLWALGFQTHDMAGDASTRVLIHSITGCFFYGAFATKVLAVRVRRLPGWTLPVVGGLVFSALVVIFLTSSVWFFTNRPAGTPLF